MIIDFYRLSEKNRVKVQKELKQAAKANLRYLTDSLNGIEAIESLLNQGKHICKPKGFVRGVIKADGVDDPELNGIVRAYSWIDEPFITKELVEYPDNLMLKILRNVIEIAWLSGEVAVVAFSTTDEYNFYESDVLNAFITNPPIQLEYTFLDIESKKVDIANRKALESYYSL